MDNQKQLNELVSVHLGRAGDGSVVKPYVTPDSVDPTLMVAVPRELNRVQYGITKDTPMYGCDVWHGYEFSTLTQHGYPISGTMKWVYSSNSTNIIESKSAKLYLNSYNMHRWKINDDMTGLDGIVYDVQERFATEFERNIGATPNACLQVEDWQPETHPFTCGFTRLESVVDVLNTKFTVFNEDPNILVPTPATSALPFAVTTNALRSNCRVTNQPDWGDVFVYIEGSNVVTPTSLLQYIVSMRKENHFHEEICECIYKRLLDILNPDKLMVSCLYTRRGGIDINPIRANSMELITSLARGLVNPFARTRKTMRQ